MKAMQFKKLIIKFNFNIPLVEMQEISAGMHDSSLGRLDAEEKYSRKKKTEERGEKKLRGEVYSPHNEQKATMPQTNHGTVFR